ncbi:hypothetical protein TVD_10700 [Thioalkalivibrio versutus]|uniref:Uncharacterized protein n=1 Tax=Thioalkalivibrio versutus TaxID=106634 RepID=A0A0G3GAG1_9GAMM|nr:hypothetical protein TVD_10700 [Thioalkalivibrio versutus]
MAVLKAPVKCFLDACFQPARIVLRNIEALPRQAIHPFPLGFESEQRVRVGLHLCSRLMAVDINDLSCDWRRGADLTQPNQAFAETVLLEGVADETSRFCAQHRSQCAEISLCDQVDQSVPIMIEKSLSLDDSNPTAGTALRDPSDDVIARRRYQLRVSGFNLPLTLLVNTQRAANCPYLSDIRKAAVWD